jgi:hypothetical protein
MTTDLQVPGPPEYEEINNYCCSMFKLCAVMEPLLKLGYSLLKTVTSAVVNTITNLPDP